MRNRHSGAKRGFEGHCDAERLQMAVVAGLRALKLWAQPQPKTSKRKLLDIRGQATATDGHHGIWPESISSLLCAHTPTVYLSIYLSPSLSLSRLSVCLCRSLHLHLSLSLSLYLSLQVFCCIHVVYTGSFMSLCSCMGKLSSRGGITRCPKPDEILYVPSPQRRQAEDPTSSQDFVALSVWG